MKVVLFCGGLGTRMREFSETIPKPLVNVGQRPIIWHLMKYYAHFGHTEFILCLGFKGELIRDYFLNYNPLLFEDCCLERGTPRLNDRGSDVPDWTIYFADTGLHSNIAERLLAVRHLLAGDEVFLANYSDQLCDLDHDAYLDAVRASGSVASFVAVRPSGSFHSAHIDDGGLVSHLGPWANSEVWINGGFMVLRRAIFDYIEPNDELVEAPFQRLIAERRLYAHRHRGFWKAMDTYKDKLAFDDFSSNGSRPWEVWVGR
jgi:glucose-1-phosphate cytidylyltransferase